MSSPLRRRVGLSRNQPGSHLLKSLPGRKASRESLRSARSATIPLPTPPATTTAMAPKLKVPVAFDAPPLSTDDDNEGSESQPSEIAGKHHSPDPILDSSEDERPPRGDIRPTSFQPSTSKTNGRQGRIDAKGQEKKSSTEFRATRSRKKRRISNDDADEERPSSLTLGVGNHFKDRLGFTKTISSKIKYKPREKQKAPIDDIDDKDASNDENDYDTGKKNGSKANSKFMNIPIHDSPKRTAKFVHPGDGLSSSPVKKPKRLKMSFLETADSSDKEEEKEEKEEEEDEGSTLAKGRRTLKRVPGPTKRTPKGKPSVFIARKKKAVAGEKKTAGREPRSSPSIPSSPVKKFVIPTPFSQFEAPQTNLTLGGDGDDSDSLSDVPSDISTPSIQDLLDLELIIANTKTTTTTTTSCPWCGASVEQAFLQEFAKGKRLNVRMQSKFCQSHKKKTALETWKERKYPEVLWDELEDRFSKHREFLLGIINGNDSHYRSILATRIELGQVRSMKKEENLNPGYYGPRGLNLMCDYLVGEFGTLLKEKAVTDKVIAGRGSAAFIQSVLVAELAVQLIAEDMRVSPSEAREIMEESKALGEMVHEDA